MVAESFLAAHLLNLFVEAPEQWMIGRVFNVKFVDLMDEADSGLASFDGVGADTGIGASFKPFFSMFRGNGEFAGVLVVVLILAEQGQIRTVFSDGNGLDAAEKFAELKVGCPCWNKLGQVVGHGLLSGVVNGKKESKVKDFDSSIYSGYIVDFADRC